MHCNQSCRLTSVSLQCCALSLFYKISIKFVMKSLCRKQQSFRIGPYLVVRDGKWFLCLLFQMLLYTILIPRCRYFSVYPISWWMCNTPDIRMSCVAETGMTHFSVEMQLSSLHGGYMRAHSVYVSWPVQIPAERCLVVPQKFVCLSWQIVINSSKFSLLFMYHNLEA